MSDFTVEDLEAIVLSRLADTGEGSYTRTLAAKGIETCAQKVGEEAVETVIAAVKGERDALVGETADLLFHLTVTLAVSGVTWREVCAELERRTGQSGLAEKARRLSRD